MELILAGLLAVALGALVLLVLRRPGDDGTLTRELARLARQQEELRLDVERGRASSLERLGDATREIRNDIGEARRALSEVRVLEEARVRQMDQASDSLRRLEAVIRYQLFEPAAVRLEIRTEEGGLVDVVEDGAKPAGVHEVKWAPGRGPGRSPVTGGLTCRIEAAGARAVRTVSLP